MHPSPPDGQTNAGYRLPSPNPHAGSLVEADYIRAARELETEPAVIQAVAAVTGSGFFTDGRPKILFDAHLFGQFTDYQYARSHPGISSRSRLGLSQQPAPTEYERLAEALTLDGASALRATAWGKFQILGTDFRIAGHDSIDTFVAAMFQSEGRHLEAFVHVIKNSPTLHRALQAKDWASFAGDKSNHHLALQQQYDALRMTR